MTSQRPEHLNHPESGVRSVLAPNPSPMTYWGTNTYLLGTGQVAVLDPGPNSPTHLQAILRALKPGETISHIVVTHTHVDHSPLAHVLAKQTGAPVLAFGGPMAGRSTVMQDLVQDGMTGGGEGIDHSFTPDIQLSDGDSFGGPDWELTGIWTPGHIGNHLCFAWGDRLFTGDHVMGWAASLVSPPDGDLTDFMASLDKLSARTDRIYFPGHGAPVTDPLERLNWLKRHRNARTQAILDALSDGPADVHSLTDRIYTDTDPALHPAARRNVLAHLIHLVQTGQVAPLGKLSALPPFRLR